MQIQAYDGYIENGQFYPKEKSINLTGRFRAVLTVLDILTQEDTSTNWADELLLMVNEDISEKLSMEDFPRMDFGHERQRHNVYNKSH